MLAFLRATVRKQRLNALPVSLSSNTIRSFAWPPHHSAALELDISSTAGAVSQEKECSRKRQRNDSCGRAETKACREKLRREKLNDKYVLY